MPVEPVPSGARRARELTPERPRPERAAPSHQVAPEQPAFERGPAVSVQRRVERNALRNPGAQTGELGNWDPGTWREFTQTVRARAPRSGMLDPFNPTFMEGVSDAFLDRIGRGSPSWALSSRINLMGGYDNENGNAVIYETLARMVERGFNISVDPQEDPRHLPGEGEGARVLSRMAAAQGWNPADIQLAGASLAQWQNDPVMQHIVAGRRRRAPAPVTAEARLAALESAPPSRRASALKDLLRQGGSAPTFGDLFERALDARINGRFTPAGASDLSFAELALSHYGDEGAAAVLSGLLTRQTGNRYARFLTERGIPGQHESRWAKARTLELGKAISQLSALRGEDLRYVCSDILRNGEQPNLSTLALRVALLTEGVEALGNFWVTQGSEDRTGFVRAVLEHAARVPDPAPYLDFLTGLIDQGELVRADLVGASTIQQVQGLLAGPAAARLRHVLAAPVTAPATPELQRAAWPLREMLGARTTGSPEGVQRLADRLGALRARGVTIDPQLEQQILSQPARQAALLQTDFANRTTALDQIERVAAAERMVDGQPPAALAAEMLKLAGAVREERGWGMSYARVNQVIFSAHHAGEFCRLLADLAVNGETTLASGQHVRWNPTTLRIQDGRHLEFLWGSLNHLLIGDSLTADATLPAPPRRGSEPIARRGQMANMMTRLMGQPYVNVPGGADVSSLRSIIDAYGPVLAKYGDDSAGSLAGIQDGGAPLTLEPGMPVPEPTESNLEWAVVPHEALGGTDLEPIRFRAGAANYIHDAVPPRERPTAPVAPAGRSLSVRTMTDSLNELDVELNPQTVAQIAQSPARVEALNQRDASGTSVFEQIFRVAAAEQLHDGTDSRALAKDLFESAGVNRPTRSAIRCYARTLFGIYMKQKPAEISRWVADLAVDGRTTLPGGQTVRWDPNLLGLGGNSANAADTLFGALTHTVKAMRLPDDAVLVNNGEYAFEGEMANVHTRLTGRRFINVSGQQALPHVNGVVAESGPLLAEYGAHGGSVTEVRNGQVLSFESGQDLPQIRTVPGYVAFPEDVAQARGLTIVQPRDPNRGYAVN